MATYTVKPNQTLADIAVMATGTMENLSAIAAANDMAVSDTPAVNAVLTIPDGLTTDTNTLSYLGSYAVVIATMGADDRVFAPEFDTTFA